MSQYEFSADQNKVIKSLSQRLILLSVLIILAGIALVFFEIQLITASGFTLQTLTFLFAALTSILTSIVLFRPSDNLKRIVNTEGNDVEELMTAFDEFRGGFKIILGMIVVSLVLNILASFL